MGGAPPVAPTGRSDLASPVPVGGEVLCGYVVELEAGLQTHAQQPTLPALSSLKNGYLHFFPAFFCLINRIFRLRGELPV